MSVKPVQILVCGEEKITLSKTTKLEIVHDRGSGTDEKSIKGWFKSTKPVNCPIVGYSIEASAGKVPDSKSV